MSLTLELLVERREGASRHEDLAAHLERRPGRVLLEAEGDGADRAQVGGDVLAGRAVAARRPAYEATLLVAQADGEPVDLQLADVRDRTVLRSQAETAPDARVELAQLVGAEGVAEAEHGRLVPHRREAALDRGPHALGRRVRRHELGMGGLELVELLEEEVVLAVAHRRRVEHVVAVVCVVEKDAQLGDPGGRIGRRHRFDSRRGRQAPVAGCIGALPSSAADTCRLDHAASPLGVLRRAAARSCPSPSRARAAIAEWVPEIVERIPHDPSAWTQGLVLDGDRLFESTGRYGESALRELDRDSGAVIDETRLEPTLYGEGLALVDDRLLQLTWREEVMLVWDRDTLTETGRIGIRRRGLGPLPRRRAAGDVGRDRHAGAAGSADVRGGAPA